MPVRLTAPDGVPPRYALPGDAGADLSLAEDVELAPFQRALVGTGVAVAIPEGYAGFVHPRSGLAHRLGLSLVNAPGHDRRRLPRRDQGQPDQPRPDGAAHPAPRRPDRPAGRPAGGAGPVRAGRRAARQRARATAGTARPAAHAADRTQQFSRGGSDMPLGRRRNRIDRSLRERGVPPEPQHREREVEATTRPVGRGGRPGGRPRPHRPRRAAAAGAARDGPAGRAQPAAEGRSPRRCAPGSRCCRSSVFAAPAGRRHLGRASARTSRRAPPGRAARCARWTARSARSSPARSSPPRRPQPGQAAAAAGAPSGPVPRRRRPALVPARHDQRPGGRPSPEAAADARGGVPRRSSSSAAPSRCRCASSCR